MQPWGSLEQFTVLFQSFIIVICKMSTFNLTLKWLLMVPIRQQLTIWYSNLALQCRVHQGMARVKQVSKVGSELLKDADGLARWAREQNFAPDSYFHVPL